MKLKFNEQLSVLYYLIRTELIAFLNTIKNIINLMNQNIQFVNHLHQAI